MKRIYAILFLTMLLLPACSIKQEVTSVKQQSETEISIIEDKEVREGVLPAYSEILRAKGYNVTVLPDGSPIPQRGLATTYNALWSWDLAIYMSYAVLEVFRDGTSIGKATYDSRSGGGNFDKFIKGEEKIKELANILFPARAGTSLPNAAPVSSDASPKQTSVE